LNLTRTIGVTIYCYEVNFIVTSKSRALEKPLIVMDQLWHLVREGNPKAGVVKDIADEKTLAVERHDSRAPTQDGSKRIVTDVTREEAAEAAVGGAMRKRKWCVLCLLS